MAGSRLPSFGTIFSRTTGLLKSGAVKEVPLWYDVYRKYPPELEPSSERSEPPQDPIPEIVYEEDFDRAKLAVNKYKARSPERTVKKKSLSDVAGHASNLIREISG